MDLRLLRAYLVELIGTFALVFVCSGLACVNVMTSAAQTAPGSTPLTLQQPGLVGVALGQALIWMALAAWSAPISGGHLNPAIAVVQWIFNQLSTVRLAWFLGAQILGGVLAGLALKFIFAPDILQTAHYGAPFLNPQAYPPPVTAAGIWAGFGIEFLLTFFFGLTIFANVNRDRALWMSGAVLAAATLFAGPLTGAGFNPARWFGPAFWQLLDGDAGSAVGQQALIYIAGPIVGALLAGTFAGKVARQNDE